MGLALVTSEGGFVHGKTRSKHGRGCNCPNCTRVRRMLAEGFLQARYLTPEEEAEVVRKDLSSHETMQESEKRRRAKIGRQNSAKVPWNAGRSWDEGVKQRIRERTTEAMKRSDIREKLRESALRQGPAPEEKRRRISLSLRLNYTRRKTRAFLDNLRHHFVDNGPFLLAPPAESEPPEPSGREEAEKNKSAAKTGPKSEEHRRKIAETMRRKWQDPSYRQRTVEAIRSSSSQPKAPPSPSQRASQKSTGCSASPKKASSSKQKSRSKGGRLTEEQLEERRRLVERARKLLRQAENAAENARKRAASGENVSTETIARYDRAVAEARRSVRNLEKQVASLESRSASS